MKILESVVRTYEGIWQHRAGLWRVMLFWYTLAVVTQVLTGAGDLNNPENTSALAEGGNPVWAVVHLLAIFLGWHSAHRYLIAQGQGASLSPLEYLRDQTPIRFVLNQLLNMLLMLALALLLLIPVTLYFAQDAALMSEQDAARLQAMISVTALPIMFVVFARLLLVAPMAARGQKKAVMRSLLATKGHFIRLNILQSVCILPMILTSFAGAIVRYAGGGNTVGLVAEALVTVAGTLYSILLYTQLAEDEYKKLASAL